jgi:hypothetical protein
MLNFIQNGTQPVPERPVGLDQEEGFDEQLVGPHAAPAVPVAVEVGDEEGEVLRFLVGQRDDAIAVLGGEPLDRRTQRRLEAPLRLGRQLGRLGRLPLAAVRLVLLEITAHPLAAVEEVLLGGAAQSAELIEMPVAHPRHRPATLAVDDDDGVARCQVLPHERLVGLGQLQPLDAEIGHQLQHQPILVRIVHVVELDFWVGLQQLLARLPAGLEPGDRVIGMNVRLAHRHEDGLRQPGMPSAAARWVKAPFDEPIMTPG